MSKVSIGKKVPQFSLPATGEQIIKLSELKGKNIVLYFYPKDSTPGCTLEGQDFRDYIRKFSSRNTRILGVSRDTLSSHEKNKNRNCININRSRFWRRIVLFMAKKSRGPYKIYV